MKQLLPILLLLFCFELSAQKKYSLIEAIGEARNKNLVLKTEKYSINIAAANITTAKLRPNPVFNDQALQLANSVHYPLNPSTGFFHPSNQQLWYQLTKPMLLGNLRGKRIAVAKQGLENATSEYRELNRNLGYDVGLKWLDVWLLKTEISIYKDAKTHVDSLVNLKGKQNQDPPITPIEFIRAQLISDHYNIQLMALNNQYIDELRDLKFLIGIEDSIDIDDTKDFIVSDFFENKDSILAIAMGNRSDLSFAKSNIELNKKNIRVQKAAGLPYFEGGIIYNPQNLIPYVGTFATLSVPIFSRNQGEREKSQYLFKQSESYKSAKEMQIRTEITNAHFSIITHRSILEETKKLVTNSSKLLSSIGVSHLNGEMTLVDFMDAQRTFVESQRLYYEAEYDYKKSYIDVLYYTGLIENVQ